MTRWYRIRALLLVVCLCSVNSLWATEGISSKRLIDISQQVVAAEFDWRFDLSSDGEKIGLDVIGFKIDEITFSPKLLLNVDLEVWWKENRIQRTIALLIDSLESWEASYTQRLSTMLRANSGVLLFEEGQETITDALDSGYWTTTGDGVREKGDVLWIHDYLDNPIARLVVVDSFPFTEEENTQNVTELTHLWTTRPLIAGMHLIATTDITTRISIPVSLDRIGVELTVELPLPGTLFRFSAKVGAERSLHDSLYEITVGLGMFRRVSLGSFATETTSLGRWWTNMQITVGMHMQAGAILQGIDTVRFLYGGDIYLELGHQSTAHWYWAVSAGYRYRAMLDGGVATSVQSNEKGITLSPTFGWVW